MASEGAFNRLTPIQQKYVNRQLFDTAYDIVTGYNDYSQIQDYVITHYQSHEKQQGSKTYGPKGGGSTHKVADVLRYCRLVMRVL